MNKKIKILLIAPYVTGMLDGFEELGICYIASVLRANGYETMLVGTHVDLIDYDKIAEFKPGIVGITVYNMTQKASYDISKKLRQMIKDVYICVGGTQPTYAGETMMQECPEIDFSIRGEGEIPWMELISAIEEKKDYSQIKGLLYRAGEKIIVNSAQQYISDLDSLPFPARDILISKNLNVAQISTSRGCTGRCSFCSSQLFWKKWRGRSVKNIVDEIEEVVNKYNVHMFSFIDSSFEDPGVKFGRIQGIAQEIIDRNLFITYFADVRAEFHRDATPELMRSLKASGLICVMVGIETNNENDIKVYNKKATLEDNEKTIKLFTDYGIVVKCGFINFNPYSTFEGLRKNIDFLEKYRYALNLECTASRFMMYKGTALYAKVKEDSLTTGNDINEKGYTYVDKRIEVFADYVYDYLRQESKLGTAFERIRYFNPYYKILIASCQRQFSCEKHSKAYSTLQNFLEANQNKTDEICSEINERIATWFRELQILAENKWDIFIADEISKKYLSEDYVQSIANELDKIKNKFYISISRLGSEYGKYLVKIS